MYQETSFDIYSNHVNTEIDFSFRTNYNVSNVSIRCASLTVFCSVSFDKQFKYNFSFRIYETCLHIIVILILQFTVCTMIILQPPSTALLPSICILILRRYMAEILPIRRKTPSSQSIVFLFFISIFFFIFLRRIDNHNHVTVAPHIYN